MKLILVVAVVAAACLQCDAKTFTRRELVRELRKQNFPASQLRDWVCLVEKESGSSTHVILPQWNGSHGYGLFQINDRYCRKNSSTPGMYCKATYAQLRTYDIIRASTCARKIYGGTGSRRGTAR